MIRKALIASITVSAFALPAFGASLDALVGAERAAALRVAASQGELVTEVQLRNPSLRLAPQHGEVGRFVREAMSELGPGILVETLFLYSKPHGRATAWTEEERAGLFNSVTALSTLAGTQYFSASRGAMRTFYETSQVIDNPRDRRPLPDPSFAVPPATLVLYARQRDLTFGDNVYRFDYRAGPDFILFMQENMTAMTAGIIPAVGRNRLRTVVAIIDVGDSLLIYAAAMARAASIPGMGERIGNSFNNRLAAMLSWFSDHADRVFR